VVYVSESIHELRLSLVCHQKRLRAGERLLGFTELAQIAGVHRDTLYSLMAGNRICERSQYAISKALKMVNESSANQPSRLMSIEIRREGPKLRFGLTTMNIF
jgi:hypothetical protein